MTTPLDAIAALAQRAYADLPESFRTHVGEIEIRVAEWPSQDALDALDIDHPLGLLGLFEGVGLAHGWSTAPTGALPNRVWLYAEPILAYRNETGDALADIVRHVLVHEIGHHFGLSDDDMYAIDDAPDT